MDSLSQFSLAGKRALITGSSRGIGFAIAAALAGAGADVVLNSRDPETLGKAAADLADSGARARGVAFDVTSSESVGDAIEFIETEIGPIDILVNNAGTHSSGPISNVQPSEWATVLEVNLSSTYHYVRATSDSMCSRGWGRIINIASITGQTGGVSGSVAYSSSKGGMIAFTKTLARDLGPSGVTVNAIAPGQIDTRMGTAMPADYLAALTAQIPLGRLGSASDIAFSVRFLASEEAGYITGATLDVNGGIAKR